MSAPEPMSAPAKPASPGSMAVVQGIDALERSRGRLFVVVGVFDGLHRGHAYLLDELRRGASAHDARPAVITFDHHPDEILTGSAPPLLCDPAERLERLEAAGVAVTVVQTFDVALRETPYDVFVRRIAERVDLAGFLMTPESAFGYQRAGTPEMVAALGRELSYEVVVVPQFRDGRGEVVSSGAIRAAIARGDLLDASRRLGRPYAVTGASVETTARHRCELITTLPMALPPAGTYAVRVEEPDSPPNDRTVDDAVIDEAGRLFIACHHGPLQRVMFEVDPPASEDHIAVGLNQA